MEDTRTAAQVRSIHPSIIANTELRRWEPSQQLFLPPFVARLAAESQGRVPTCHRSAFPSATAKPAESQSPSSALQAGDRL